MYLLNVALAPENLVLLEIDEKEYSNASGHLLEALEIREKLAAANPPASDIALCRTMLTIVFLSKSAPDIVSAAGVDIPALMNRAIAILNKYPDIPQAQKLLKTIEELER